MEEDVFFDRPLHVNMFKYRYSDGSSFDLQSEDSVHLLDQLTLSIEGSIMAVKTEAIKPYLKDQEVRNYRYGIKKIPRYFEIRSDEDFFRTLAIFVPLSEII